MALIEQFKVVTISTNTNSFGLYSVILITKMGIAYQVLANSLNKPNAGDILNVWFSICLNETIRYDFVSLGFEVPERLANVPNEITKNLF